MPHTIDLSPLYRALATGRCVVFAGAGVSADARRADGRKLPLWRALLVELLELAKTDDHSFDLSNDIDQMISRDRLLSAAQELQDRLGEDDLARYFDLIFGDSGLGPGEVHKTLPGLGLRAILTSNYDDLIEASYASANGGNSPLWFTYESYISESPNPIRTPRFFIYKVHGDYRNVSTIALGTRRYQDLVHYYPGYRSMLESLLQHYTFLFVGFSGDDPDIDNVLDKLATIYRGYEPHYIILPTGRFNQSEQQRLLQDRRLQVIEYEADPTHARLIPLLQTLSSPSLQIKDTHHRTKVLIASHHDDFTRLTGLCTAFEEYNCYYSRLDLADCFHAGWEGDLRARLSQAEYVIRIVSAASAANFDRLASAAIEFQCLQFCVLLDGQLPSPLLSGTFLFPVPQDGLPDSEQFFPLAEAIAAVVVRRKAA